MEATPLVVQGDDELGDAGAKEFPASARKRRVCICLLVTAALVLLGAAVLVYRHLTIGPAFHDLSHLACLRPKGALAAEALRRRAAEEGGELYTLKDTPVAQALGQNAGSNSVFPNFNFVQGFPQPGLFKKLVWSLRRAFGLEEPRWKPPVKGEVIGVVSFAEHARQGGEPLSQAFFEDYYTGSRVPSWEDNSRHKIGVTVLDAGVKAARALGQEPVDRLRSLKKRFAFDNEALTKAAWDGFRYMGPLDIEYASNGVYGIPLMENLMEKYNNSNGEVLDVLMTDSVFSAHLKREEDGLFHVDLSFMEKYKPIPGYAPLGGSASFREEGGRLHTVKLTYDGTTYANFDVPEVDEDFSKRNKRSGWRFAEAAIIASLLSMTNLVMHVKDLHLELAAAFQAVTVDAFANEPKHPVRRLLDPFISRSVQATNDNFKLLFQYHAADFSLAPLPDDEQLKLIDESIRDRPLNLATMDMENYGASRNIDAAASTAAAMGNSSQWGWRWHYRALTVQRLYDDLVDCWLRAHHPGATVDDAVAQDGVLQAWWRSMIDHLPSLRRATRLNPEWASSEKLTAASLRHVLRTLMVWLSWIHEDVGHSAAAYVYNPVYTPMCVPEDGVGVPMDSWVFNSLAYRGFVFLHRSTLLQEPPDFWFDGNSGCRECFTKFQKTLRELGRTDPAFSECEKDGFYSCVERVDTAVSS